MNSYFVYIIKNQMFHKLVPLKSFFLLLFIMTLISFNSFAQREKVLVKNTRNKEGKQTITIKWYTNELLYPEGVNVYRKEEGGEWKKLNTVPVKKQANISPEEYKTDKDLKFFVQLVNETSRKDLNGFILLNLLVKSFESPVFANFLGIQYTDEEIAVGKRYQYKVEKILKGKEVALGLSPFINSSELASGIPVKDINLKLDTNKVKFTWKIEEERFYAVNIYRNSSLKQGFEKLNEKPVMISQYGDSTGKMVYPKIMFIDDSLKQGVTYGYKIAGIDFFGEELEHSPVKEVLIKDLIPPSAPYDLKDSVNNLVVQLRWKAKADPDITGFNVYRSIKSEGPYVKMNSVKIPVNTLSFTDKVTKASPYYYSIASLDMAGNEARSEKRFVEVHDIVPPSKPKGLTIKADTGKAILTWLKNPEADVQGYLIYRSVVKKGKENFVLINSNPVSFTTYKDALPKTFTKTSYKIIAIDSSFNRSAESEVFTVKLPDVIAPEKPFIKNSYYTDSTAVVIEWLPNIEPDLKGYQICRGNQKAPGAPLTPITPALITKSKLKFTDKTTQPGETYIYCLYAIDSAGNKSAQSNLFPVKNTKTTKFESRPENLKISFQQEKKQVVVNWKFKKSEDLKGFIVYRKEKGSPTLLPITKLMSETSFKDWDVKQGNSYLYQVRAFNDKGEVTLSEIKEISITKE